MDRENAETKVEIWNISRFAAFLDPFLTSPTEFHTIHKKHRAKKRSISHLLLPERVDRGLHGQEIRKDPISVEEVGFSCFMEERLCK